ncbi:CU044_2847 family protein [Dactylosporangium sp. NPDC048998]|uniref:CU044_2847 family protein n=1 Tax=Dactylosporangium sp. NPDC048998 TaxID=3363976 RepID=UPI00371EE1FC
MIAVPVTFAGVDVLVQATPVSVVGSEPTSVSGKVVAAYAQAEKAIMSVAESVAGTVDVLAKSTVSPQQVQVQFGVSVSVEGDIMVVKGTTGATLSITLTYGIQA